MRLMTNNPKKDKRFGKDTDWKWWNVFHRDPCKDENRYYLQTKKEKMGHMLAGL